ncbi:MAG TPA: energy transducer TonB [Opitutaceae bacterium]|jgi:protein TonB
MRRDLIIGFILTLGLEFGVAYLGDLTKYHAPPPERDTTPKIQIVVPKIEPDKPDEVEDQPPTPQDIAPPQQQDIPTVITPNAIVQQIEPPPPDLSAIQKNIVKIPETRTGLAGIEVFDISKLDQAPQPKFQARPTYPFEMRRQGISGSVNVDFIVDTDGNVRNATAVHSSQREFEAPAVQAVSKWKFKPGRKNGHAVFTHMQVPIVFTLSDEN